MRVQGIKDEVDNMVAQSKAVHAMGDEVLNRALGFDGVLLGTDLRCQSSRPSCSGMDLSGHLVLSRVHRGRGRIRRMEAMVGSGQLIYSPGNHRTSPVNNRGTVGHLSAVSVAGCAIHMEVFNRSIWRDGDHGLRDASLVAVRHSRATA